MQATEIPKDARKVIVDFSQHPKQWAIVQAMRDREILEITVRKGRRFGATFAAGFVSTEFASQFPKSPGTPTPKPTEIGFFGPVFKNARRVWQEIVDSFGAALLPPPHGYRESDLTLTWRGGARGTVFSGERVDDARGYGLDIAVIDEAALFSEHDYESAISPSLADRGGRTWFLSSPRFGEGNWFAQRAVRNESGALSWARGFHGSIYDNPHVPRAWIESKRQTVDPMTFDEEYLGLIVKSSTAYLDPSKIKTIKAEFIPSNVLTIIICDFAWGTPELVDKETRRRKDASSITVQQQDLLGNVYLVDGVYSKTLEPDEGFDIIAKFIQQYGARKLVFEKVGDDTVGRTWRKYAADRASLPTVALVRPVRKKDWKANAIRQWAGSVLKPGKFHIRVGCSLREPLIEEMMAYNEADSRRDRCHDDVLVTCADILLPTVWQGRQEGVIAREEAARGGPDLYNLSTAWARARGEFEPPPEPIGRYSILGRGW